MADRIAAAAPARRRLILWAPVCFGFGIWAFFHASTEPSGWSVAIALALAVAAWPLIFRGPRALGFALMAFALACAGFAAASMRAQMVAAPVLPQSMDATVEGRVVVLSRSRGDQLRAELGDVVIYGLARGATPQRVRVTLLEGDFARPVRVGERIVLYARLSPPGAPVEPGGFDFRRHAWFDQLGAVGYARGPVMMTGRGAPGGIAALIAQGAAKLRDRLAHGIMEALPGERGAFAAAIMVGSREGVGQEALQALRDSNLAHLLAISGLHMGLLAAIVFAAVRTLLALVPRAALRMPSKKVAAGAALAAATAYLVLSGASVATQRAYVMAAVALIAIMIDRPAISLRALAAAALAILILRPENLLDAGFQMSFAATTALVAAWESGAGRRARHAGEGRGARLRILRWALALLFTSLVAGLATAPFGAMHFNRISQFGLLANLGAVPIMGFVTMPAGAAAAALTPLGLHEPALWVMGQSIGAILAIARWAADIPGAVRGVADPQPFVPALIVLGGLFVCLGATRFRLVGLAPLALGLALWAGGPPRPVLLIAPGAEALGLIGPEGRAVDHARGARYAVQNWLASDGDGATQEQAAARPGLLRQGRRTEGEIGGGWRVVRVTGRASPDQLAKDCVDKVLLIAPGAPRGPDGPCLYLGPDRLGDLGAMSVAVDGQGLRIRSAMLETAGRIWSAPAPKGAEADPLVTFD
ncbi:MAG: competence protein ComEC [Paracoccaceae bacterium]|jgi:competence protein ComEC